MDAYTLQNRIIEVRKQLTDITDSVLRGGQFSAVSTHDYFGIRDIHGEARYQRRIQAEIIRNELFHAADQLWQAGQPQLPKKSGNPEDDIGELLTWIRQIIPPSQDEHLPITQDPEDFKFAKWFEENTIITGESLRKAVSDGKPLRTIGTGKKRYSLTDAMAIWGSEIVVNKA